MPEGELFVTRNLIPCSMHFAANTGMKRG
jgi:hypothetical protein